MSFYEHPFFSLLQRIEEASSTKPKCSTVSIHPLGQMPERNVSSALLANSSYPRVTIDKLEKIKRRKRYNA